MSIKKQFSLIEAKQIGDALGIDWQAFGVEQFQMGLGVELEHGARDAQTNVTGDDAMITGKIAWAHLKEFPDYYTRLLAMEKEADKFWGKGGDGNPISMHGLNDKSSSSPPSSAPPSKQVTTSFESALRQLMIGVRLTATSI
jgi:hypothetical protein